jgi:hypothetical protein
VPSFRETATGLVRVATRGQRHHRAIGVTLGALVPIEGECCHFPIVATMRSALRVTAPGSGTGIDQQRLARLAVALALLPLVVSAVALVVGVGTSYHAGSDIGLTELRTNDVGRHPVLVGLYAHERWNHPGPALFYALALPYRLSGRNSIGLALGALLINGSAIVGIAVVARRLRGAPLMLLTLVGCALLVRALGPAFLRDPWNPYITVLPFGFLVFLTWAMTCGEAWALPVGVGMASFCVQTHIGYAPTALPLVAFGAIALIERTRRLRTNTTGERLQRSRDLLRAGLVAAAVLIVLWSPVVIQQLFDSPGNITEIVRYFTRANGLRHSLGEGYRAVSGQFGVAPQWLTGHVERDPFTGQSLLLHSAPPPVWLIPLGLAAVAFWRWRCSDANRLVATLLVALTSGVFAVTRIIGPAYAYRFRWTWVLAMVAFIVVGWAAWTLIASGARRTGATHLVLAVPLFALVLLGAVNGVSAARAGAPQQRISSAVHTLGPAVEAALPEGKGEVLVSGTPAGALAGYESALVLYLEGRGVAVRVDRSREDAYGAHRVRQPDAPFRAGLTVAANEDFDEMSTRLDRRLVAYWGTRSRAGRAAVLGRRFELEAAYNAGTITFEILKHELSSLHLGPAVGVFM